MNIAIIGMGYVGLANALLLAKRHTVMGVELDTKKVEMLNNGISPITDELIISRLSSKIDDGSFKATNNISEVMTSDLFIIATPTNYDVLTNEFDTSSVDKTISFVLTNNPDALIYIKSTIPVGYTELKNDEYNTNNIYFSPEFLREGRALYDNLHPSRIIVGGDGMFSGLFANMLSECAEKENIEVLLTSATEAEAIKLFSNTYLAMRVSFFNELDTFAEIKGLDTASIIKGVSLDPRIGDYYNNPSFGYGGYCLPKDTKQLLANYNGVPQVIMGAIVDSNQIRKQHIFETVLSKNPKTVGVYRLIMKTGSDNFRDSAIFDIINMLLDSDVKVIVYEPFLTSELVISDVEIYNDFTEFERNSDLILSNRIDEHLSPHSSKVYSRDVFTRD
ncbi:MAG: nucleotide sugar dehydrogenase [Erysipelothrix sp.]